MDLRFVFVVGVVLGEDAHAQLVEGGRAESRESLGLERVALMGPGVAGGADGDIGRAVCVGEVKNIRNPDRAVIAGRRWSCLKAARFAGGGCVGPLSLGIRHEAELVDALAVLKAVDMDDTMFVAEFGTRGC